MSLVKERVRREDGGYDFVFTCPYADDAGRMCAACEGTGFLVRHVSPDEIQRIIAQVQGYEQTRDYDEEHIVWMAHEGMSDTLEDHNLTLEELREGGYLPYRRSNEV